MLHWLLRSLLLLLLLEGGFTPLIQARPTVMVADQPGITFQIVFNQGSYEVYLQPNSTPAAPNATLTAQVTVKVPHGVGVDRFLLGNVKNAVIGTAWRATSRIDAPTEDPTADYISFELSLPTGDFKVFNWQADQAVKVFSFQNLGLCLGPVTLLSNADPFMPPNSMSTNPGNQITVMGIDADNAYLGNQGVALAECSLAASTSTPISTPTNTPVAPTVSPTITATVTPLATPTLSPPTAVTFVAFSGTWQGDHVLMQWETSSELNTYGFQLYRSLDHDRANARLITPVTIPSQSTQGGRYLFRDMDVAKPVAYFYWLEEVTIDGHAVAMTSASVVPSQYSFLPMIHFNP